MSANQHLKLPQLSVLDDGDGVAVRRRYAPHPEKASDVEARLAWYRHEFGNVEGSKLAQAGQRELIKDKRRK